MRRIRAEPRHYQRLLADGVFHSCIGARGRCSSIHKSKRKDWKELSELQFECSGIITLSILFSPIDFRCEHSRLKSSLCSVDLAYNGTCYHIRRVVLRQQSLIKVSLAEISHFVAAMPNDSLAEIFFRLHIKMPLLTSHLSLQETNASESGSTKKTT